MKRARHAPGAERPEQSEWPKASDAARQPEPPQPRGQPEPAGSFEANESGVQAAEPLEAHPPLGAPRFFVGHDTGAPQLAPWAEFNLPAGAAQHVRVRRLQPGAALQLFDGQGVEWPGVIVAMGRHDVRVRLGVAATAPAAPELPWHVTLAFGVPANERADALVEKATELGAAALQPLICERSVLRLAGERAERRCAHWQAVAVAASEQCGRATVPQVHPWRDLAAWLEAAPVPSNHPRGHGVAAHAQRWLLSTDPAALPMADAWRAQAPAQMQPGVPAPVSAIALVGGGRATAPPLLLLLSGPEGGLSRHEERTARAAGFGAVSLGPRILRADTAPLAALAFLALHMANPREATPKAG